MCSVYIIMSANKKSILQRILLEEEEDDDLILYYFYKNVNEDMFKKYCRLNKEQFYFVLSLIEKEMEPKRTGTVISFPYIFFF